MRVCSESRPAQRRKKYSVRQPAIPQPSPARRSSTRAVRFGNEGGAISIGQNKDLQQLIFKSIPARKSTQSVLLRFWQNSRAA